VLRAIAGHVAAWPQRQIRQIRWACTDRIQLGLFLTWLLAALRPSHDFLTALDDHCAWTIIVRIRAMMMHSKALVMCGSTTKGCMTLLLDNGQH
jgi:hypothetical protein